MLYDPSDEKEIYSYNAHRYFTPASNTKILTFYTSLVILGDSIPALKFSVVGDSVIFQGTGDPSFLYNQVWNSDKVYSFLRDAPGNLYFSPGNFQTTQFGPGWAWDDYNYYYSAERSPFPVYGNRFTLFKPSGDGSLRAEEPYFKRFVYLADSLPQSPWLQRDFHSMETNYYPAATPDSVGWEIPFRTDPLLVAAILSDTLKRPVRITSSSPGQNAQMLYSLPADSLYRVMLQNSDNFIAEQLLTLCAGVLSDTLNPDIAIRYMEKNYLNDLSDPPQWVDGSGLSRYNLITPASIVGLWEKIYHRVPAGRLFHLLAAGGAAGTIKSYYKDDKPYIYGKTGTLSNNHALSGYLITRSGHILIFSFMNSNYVAPLHEVRENMEEVLKFIRENYKG